VTLSPTQQPRAAPEFIARTVFVLVHPAGTKTRDERSVHAFTTSWRRPHSSFAIDSGCAREARLARVRVSDAHRISRGPKRKRPVHASPSTCCRTVASPFTRPVRAIDASNVVQP
jgi:hypothetical protein